MIVRDVQVAHIRYQSENGAVFSGDILHIDGTLKGERVNVALPGKIAGQDFALFKGQVFKISGFENTWLNKQTGELEPQINVRKLFEIRGSGSSFVAYVAGNKAFQGVGASTAMALWRKHGRALFGILKDEDVDALTVVDGVSEAKAHTLIEVWKEQNRTNVIDWLEIYSLPVKIARHLYSSYNNNAIERLNSDPYRLLAFAQSWQKVDALAREHFSIEINDPRRLHAAVSEALFRFYDDGDTAARAQPLTAMVTELIGENLASAALCNVFVDGGFVRVSDELYQSRGANLQERFLAKKITERFGKHCPHNLFASDPAATSIGRILNEFRVSNFLLTEEQRTAVETALISQLSIITGGAGVGKSSVLPALHLAIEGIGGTAVQIDLACRPTKRMQGATGRKAMTITEFLLSMDSSKLGLVSHIIMDEASMLDLPNAVAVLKKLTSEHKVVLVGDDALLPPAGPGEVFSVLAKRSEIPVTRLTKIFQQSDSSGVQAVAGAIREGVWPKLEKFSGKGQGVSLLMADSKSVGNLIFEAYDILGGPNENEDVRIICPTNSDQHWGAAGLNRQLSKRYEGHGMPVLANRRSPLQTYSGLRIGDLVMATEGNWVKGVMKGSLGKIVCHATESEISMATKVDAPTPVIHVEFDHVSVLIDEEDIKTLVWGYAITCREAHGAQFRRVIIPVVNSEKLDTAMIYTALTRGLDQVVLVGDEHLMRQAVCRKLNINQIGIPQRQAS